VDRVSRCGLAEILPFEIVQDGDGGLQRQLGFDTTGNSTIRSADPKNYHRTKHEVYQITRCADTAIRNFPRWRAAAILDLM